MQIISFILRNDDAELYIEGVKRVHVSTGMSALDDVGFRAIRILSRRLAVYLTFGDRE